MALQYDSELLFEIRKQLFSSIEVILKRSRTVKSSDDFLLNERSLERLDSICMQLIALGENIKNLDKITHRKLLKKFPEFDWKGAMGMRDILSHHYFNVNAEIVFQVCKEEIPILKNVLEKIFHQK